MSPEAMKHAVRKVRDSGNNNANDYGSRYHVWLPRYDCRFSRNTNYEISMELQYLMLRHSLQQPNQSSGVTGGRPDMIETIARAGIVTGVDGLFLETHFDPGSAKK